jgi:hypothetical protein
MGCVLRAYGSEFKVDSFLRDSSLKPYSIYRRGEPRFENKPDGELNDSSGLKIDVSDAEFEDLHGQVAGAISFLRRNQKELKRLRRFPGVERACLDFALSKRDVPCQYDTFPAELLYLAGGVGLDIELSQFPAIEDAEEE